MSICDFKIIRQEGRCSSCDISGLQALTPSLQRGVDGGSEEVLVTWGGCDECLEFLRLLWVINSACSAWLLS